jgi:hypothetical protein
VRTNSSHTNPLHWPRYETLGCSNNLVSSLITESYNTYFRNDSFLLIPNVRASASHCLWISQHPPNFKITNPFLYLMWFNQPPSSSHKHL